ncbi:MAG: hypothetical protein R8G33_05075 [Gammaproteobacteria bacterium]|nr:hypothetical protein [Gammaproteobacteria bacterium]
MFISKLITISSILFALSLFSLVSYADVEDIIDSQAEILKSDEQQRKHEKFSLKKSKNGVELGRQEFIDTCVICHGDDAKGKGLFSPHLANKPKDLTLIEMNNNGVFPFKRLYEIIDGRKDESMHGTRTMPIWGDKYSAESWLKVSTQHAETLARGKIFELLLYLESIQDN